MAKRYHPAPPSPGLALPGLILQPLRGSDAVRDLAALELAREALLRRSGYRWPRPGFTLNENLADLLQHEREHEAREAFTYTLLEPASGRCVGCLYMRPLRRTLQRLARGADRKKHRERAREARKRTPRAASDVTFWTVPELHGRGLDRRLLAELPAWLRRDFAFERVWLVTNDAETRVRRLAEGAGLKRKLRLRSGGRGWRFHELR